MKRSNNVRRFVYCAPISLFPTPVYFHRRLFLWAVLHFCLFISFLHAWRLAEGKLFCLCYVGNLSKYREIRSPLSRTVVLQWHCALPKEILFRWHVPFGLPTLQTAYNRKEKQEEKNIPSEMANRDAASQTFLFYFFVQTLLPHIMCSFRSQLQTTS